MLVAGKGRNLKGVTNALNPEAEGDLEFWPAPCVSLPVAARVTLPGSKSLAARELVLQALAEDSGTVSGLPGGRDTVLLRQALAALGTGLDETSPGSGVWRVCPSEELHGACSIDCGLAGTVMRFVPPVAALALGPVSFDGDAYARRRPLAPLLQALGTLGADVVCEGAAGLPFTVHGRGFLEGGECTIDASLSSQFVSALLLCAPRFRVGLKLRHTGGSLPSEPHIAMTLACLRARGVAAHSPRPGVWEVEPGPIAAAHRQLEPDLSNAAPFLAAALVRGGSVTVCAWPKETEQVGAKLPELLTLFGAAASYNEATRELTVTAQAGALKSPGTLHLPEAGELAPTLVGLAALAGGTSEITGIAHIRHHETDRLAALKNELNERGCTVTELPDGLRIVSPGATALKGGIWRCYADHRMATTGALLGLAIPELKLDNVACTDKTLPGFTGLWRTVSE